MQYFSYKDITYQVDDQGFLLDSKFWDKNFAEGIAKQCEVPVLGSEHWDVISYVRDAYDKTNICPTIFATCKALGLRPREMKKLFPTGYHRGLCQIAGIHYRVYSMPYAEHLKQSMADLRALSGDKTYSVDVRGFLADPDSWDENYAMHRALEMKIPEGQLTDKHWQVLYFLRDTFKKEKRIPNIYETCENCNMEFDEFESLFPDGYHRGAIKIAGLRFVK